MVSRVIDYVTAVNETLHQEMRRDENVIVIGEDIGGGAGRAEQGLIDAWGGPFGATKGLIKVFGPGRVWETPISECGFVGAAVGAASTGLRPVVELMFNDFIGVAFEPILNQMSKLHYMFGGKVSVPLTLRTTIGAGFRAASHHSQCLYSIYTHIPGLKVVLPSTPYDAKGLLAAAIRDDDPVVVCEHKGLYGMKGEVPEEPYTIPLGLAEIKRPGKDVTIVALSKMVHVALEAAGRLEKEGISVEVIDPRTVSPLDEETILASVARTNHLVVVDESYPRCSLASEIAAVVAEKGFNDLDGAIRRVTAPHTPVPFSPVYEDYFIPSVDKVMAAVKATLGMPASSLAE